MTEEEIENAKDKYVEMWKKQGIIIDKRRVKKDDGMRNMAKICLNSMWVGDLTIN